MGKTQTTLNIFQTILKLIFTARKRTQWSLSILCVLTGASLIALPFGAIQSAISFVIPNGWTEKPLTVSLLNSDTSFISQASAIVAGFLLIGFGMYIGGVAVKINSRKRILPIEHLGLPNLERRGFIKNLPKEYASMNRDEVVLVDGRDISPEEQLNRIQYRIADLTDKIAKGGDPNDYIPMYGGLAQVPMVACAGFLWGNKTPIHVRDYDRQKDAWHDNDQPDDDAQLELQSIPAINLEDKEFGVCLEFSIKMDRHAMARDFPGLPLYFLRYSDRLAGYDKISSADKQARFAHQISQYLNDLIRAHKKVDRVHLFVTAQNSFVFRLGQQLNQLHMPTFQIHYYDARVDPPGHPWSIKVSQKNDGPEVIYNNMVRPETA
jgi:hypothetical protein